MKNGKKGKKGEQYVPRVKGNEKFGKGEKVSERRVAGDTEG